MTTQLYTILNFPQFYANTSSVRLPIKTAYKLSRLQSAISTEIEFYQNKTRTQSTGNPYISCVFSCLQNSQLLSIFKNLTTVDNKSPILTHQNT